MLRHRYSGYVARDGQYFESNNSSSSSSSSADKRRRKLPRDDGIGLPRTHCGFGKRVHSLPPHTVRWTARISDEHVVSLALLDDLWPEMRLGYASKLPIMCVSTARLAFTRAAFALTEGRDAARRAVEFYLQTDIERVRRRQEPSNAKFSSLLHTLRLTCYEDYLFDLARRLNLGVDIVPVLAEAAQREPAAAAQRLVFSYRPKTTRRAQGVISAVRDESTSRWYVSVAERSPILPR